MEAAGASGSPATIPVTLTVSPLDAWSHLAMTWDGLTTRLYVNGTQVASGALTGTAATSALPLRIGGNTVWSEWFSGQIDEVRVYKAPPRWSTTATRRSEAPDR